MENTEPKNEVKVPNRDHPIGIDLFMILCFLLMLVNSFFGFIGEWVMNLIMCVSIAAFLSRYMDHVINFLLMAASFSLMGMFIVNFFTSQFALDFKLTFLQAFSVLAVLYFLFWAINSIRLLIVVK